MSMNCTPGPYFATGDPDEPGQVVIAETGGWWIVAKSAESEGEPTTGQDDANAELLAASWEMSEMLRYVRSLLAMDHDPAQYAKTVEKIDGLLAKAEGRS